MQCDFGNWILGLQFPVSSSLSWNMHLANCFKANEICQLLLIDNSRSSLTSQKENLVMLVVIDVCQAGGQLSWPQLRRRSRSHRKCQYRRQKLGQLSVSHKQSENGGGDLQKCKCQASKQGEQLCLSTPTARCQDRKRTRTFFQR